jgi:hypothetical protein
VLKRKNIIGLILGGFLKWEKKLMILNIILLQAWKQWKNGTPLELLDPTIRGSFSKNEVIRCIHIGLLCVQEDPANRPTMATVVLMLDSYSVSLQLPQQPAFLLRSRATRKTPTKELQDDSSTSQMCHGQLMKHRSLSYTLDSVRKQARCYGTLINYL